MLFWAVLASGQINVRKVDGWQTLATRPPISQLTSPLNQIASSGWRFPHARVPTTFRAAPVRGQQPIKDNAWRLNGWMATALVRGRNSTSHLQLAMPRRCSCSLCWAWPWSSGLRPPRITAVDRRIQHRRLRPQGACLVHERLCGPVSVRDGRRVSVDVWTVGSDAHRGRAAA